MNKPITTLVTSLAAALCAVFSAHAQTGDYPNRPITLIVPFPAGAGTDQTGRTLAACMERYIDGAKFVVHNRAGASGDIGLTALSQAAPDGYTVGIVNTPGIISIPLERQTRYTKDSFDFIANVVNDPGTINVHADSGIKTIADLVEAARKRPGEITIGTQGVGSAGHISMLLLEQAAQVKFSPVPFQGASPARVALLGKVIDGAAVNLGEAVSFRAGQPWTILGSMSPERMAQAPDVPTFKEAGYNILGGSMRGLAAPKGIPENVKRKLSDAVKQCSEDREFKEIAEKTSQPLAYLPYDKYMASLDQLHEQLQEVWKVSPWNK